MSSPEQLCIFCKNFVMESGSPGWSEYTPGWDAELRCSERVWKADYNSLDTDSYRKLMLTAKTCDKYICAGDE